MLYCILGKQDKNKPSWEQFREGFSYAHKEVQRMPQKPKTPCKHPSCPALVDAGQCYCDKHKSLHPERPSPAKRGYNSRWRKVRAAYLCKHPLCVKCLAQGRYVQATVVDHIVPHRGDPALLWNENNFQALCKPCHDKKTGLKDKNPVYHY